MNKIITLVAIFVLLFSPVSAALAETGIAPLHRTEPKTLTVDRTDDPPYAAGRSCRGDLPNDCSLRDAVQRANKDRTRPYRIIVPAGIYTLTIPGEEGANLAGDLDLHSEIELVGAGSCNTIISAGGIDRVLQVHSDARVKLTRLTLCDGQASPADPGGGVWNSGTLEMDEVVVTGNRSGDGFQVDLVPALHGDAGGGGGIYNNGTLTMKNCLVSENQAGKGGTNTDKRNSVYRNAGRGGDGGGVLNESEMTIDTS